MGESSVSYLTLRVPLYCLVVFPIYLVHEFGLLYRIGIPLCFCIVKMRVAVSLYNNTIIYDCKFKIKLNFPLC